MSKFMCLWVIYSIYSHDILLQEICVPILGVQSTRKWMNVEIGTEETQFSEKEYKNGIFVAV